MRSFLAKACMVSGLLFATSTTTADSFAQQRRPKPSTTAPKPTDKGNKPKSGADIELDETTPMTAPKDAGVTPQAGQMTEQAAQAKRLFDGEKWADGALALYRVYKGETGDDEGNKQLAQYHLAIALYRLKFYQAAYGIFSEIADKTSHLKFNETLLWLSKLATDLPEPADIVERVGKYSDAQVNKFDNDQQRDLFWQLNYLLGRYKYRNRQYDDAIRLFAKVGRNSKYYVKAKFFGGISNVQLRRSVPAVSSFKSIVKAVEEGEGNIEDAARMRDLALLSMARTFYSASVRLDEATGAPTIDQKRLTEAVYNWNQVDVASEYWLDGLFEESWAYFMAGDYAHALGNIHTIQAPYFPNSYYPESEILKAVIYFSNCQFDDATTIVSKFQQKYQPVYDDLSKVLKRFSGDNQEEEFYKFLRKVADHKTDVPDRIKIVVENALSDRQLLRHLGYIQVLDDENARFKKTGNAFQNSALGNDVKDSLQLARDIAVRNAGQLARERYERNLSELNEHLRDSAKILIDINAAMRGELDKAMEGSKTTVEESKRNIVRPDEEHVIWPFDGEYWRDELGFYRQTITSKCGR